MTANESNENAINKKIKSESRSSTSSPALSDDEQAKESRAACKGSSKEEAKESASIDLAKDPAEDEKDESSTICVVESTDLKIGTENEEPISSDSGKTDTKGKSSD